MNMKRQTAPDRARTLCANLRAVGVTLPAGVTDALDALEAVDKFKPEPVNATDVAEAYASGDGKKAARLAGDLTTHAARLNGWTEGRILAGIAALHSIRNHGDEITEALAEQAAPLIERVTAAANIDTHDLASLLQAGRADDADLVSRYELDAADLAHLYSLRDKVTAGAEYGSGKVSCSTWRDPRPILEQGHARQPSGPAEAFKRGIVAGGVLWFPTPGESKHAAAIIDREQRAEAEAEAQQAWRDATGAKRRVPTA